MRVAVIGANGQLGADLLRAFRHHEVIPWTRKDFDVRDHQRAADAILSARPEVLINTSAFHQTDACEENPEMAFAVNAIAARNLALASQSLRIKFIHISTDFVFDGRKREPYTEDDRPDPINVYGVSKLAGESFVSSVCGRYYIVRVAGLFGTSTGSVKGGNFVERILGKANRAEVLTVVDDVIMSPTYAADAADTIRQLIDADAPSGVYHVTNAGSCSWYQFAKEILERAGVFGDLRPTTIGALRPKAPRPLNSALRSSRLSAIGLRPLRCWQDALSAYFESRALEAPA